MGQTAGQGGRFLRGTAGGWAVLAPFVIVGEVAVLSSQWGFYRRARASPLVPVYNCTYVPVPVLLQAFLLSGYRIFWTTVLGPGLIMAGFVCMRTLRPEETAAIGGGLAAEGSC